MIDWFGVFHNTLWIVGLAIGLAALSYADWRRRTTAPPASFRHALAEPGFQATASLGLTLFCVGLALGSAAGWQIVAWAVLGLIFAWNTVTGTLHLRRQRRLAPPPVASTLSNGGDS